MYTIGLDFGTNSARAIIVDCKDGSIISSSVYNYQYGDMGVITDSLDPNIARQHPIDYLNAMEYTVTHALKNTEINTSEVKAIGIDATASTPIPLDENGNPLVLNNKFKDNLSAMAWLWKDHTSICEANEITALAKNIRPDYLSACGGAYSSEWYWSKVLNCLRNNQDVFNHSDSWMELQDWIPFVLTGERSVGMCAAGHKGLYSPLWGGFPDKDFLSALDKSLIKVSEKFPKKAKHIGEKAGLLNPEWADKLRLPAGIPVAVGMIDAHAGAVGSGITPGVMVKILGTSSCDIAVSPISNQIPKIPGICGIAYESVIPGCFGIEAGQSAVGDIFNWFIHKIQPGDQLTHEDLNKKAELLKPGESGLLALDWNNGNRSLLTDPSLSGLLVGTTLHTSPAEIFRTLIEATAFGSRMIIDRYKEYGIVIEKVINCGGIATKSPLTMQIYADILGCSMEVSKNEQSCALGSAIAAAVVGKIYPDFPTATNFMIKTNDVIYNPIKSNIVIYDKLYYLYKELHDAFGISSVNISLNHVMKDLIKIRNQVREG